MTRVRGIAEQEIGELQRPTKGRIGNVIISRDECIFTAEPNVLLRFTMGCGDGGMVSFEHAQSDIQQTVIDGELEEELSSVVGLN